MDIRGIWPGGARLLLEDLLQGARGAAAGRGVRLEEGPISASEPTEMDGEMVVAVEEACARLDVRCGRCVSFAGHDAQHLASAAPAALVFVVSENGVGQGPGGAVAGGDVAAALAEAGALAEGLQGERIAQAIRGRR